MKKKKKKRPDLLKIIRYISREVIGPLKPVQRHVNKKKKKKGRRKPPKHWRP